MTNQKMNQPDLDRYRWVVVNSSGGKDSQTALRVVVEACDAAGIPRDHIVVSHQCLGAMEWEGTKELAKLQADHYGLRFEVSSYRTKAGEHLSLLDYVRKRGKWPDSKNRFCTSEYKRGPGGRVLTKLFRESPGDILNVYGFRAAESTTRAKKKVLVTNARFSSSKRTVTDWLPIHTWNDKQVWAHIRASGVPYHRAYDLGMSRLSCVFCIFAPRSALLIAGKANPALLDDYCEVEIETGHTFQHLKPLVDVRAAIAAGEQPQADQGDWDM